MKKNRIGKLPPRYKFFLNHYKHFRFSSCPICRRPTHMRKFPLLIFVDDWGMLALGKTCRYCTPCELIIAHQDELEDVLVGVFEQYAPHVIGNPYLVVGTNDKKRWEASLGSGVQQGGDVLNHTADFKKVLDFDLKAGWQPMKKP